MPEATLLLAVARPRLDADDRERTRALAAEVGPTIDWAAFTHLALSHRVSCLVGRSAAEHGVFDLIADRRDRFAHAGAFQMLYQANRARNEALLRELQAIVSAMRGAGVEPVLRKGLYLAALAYEDLGAREMSDIDLLVEPDQLDEARACLADLGYEQGRLVASGRRMEPLERREALYRATQVPNVEVHRPSSSPFVRLYSVDISRNQFLPSAGWSVPTVDLQARSEVTHRLVVPVRVLVPVEYLIDLATHLYKEATTFYYLESGEDLALLKFLDIAEFVRREPRLDWSVFRERVTELGVGDPVYFALWGVEQLYPETVPASVLASLRPTDPEFVRTIGRADGDEVTWSGSFVERVFSLDRRRTAPRSRSPLSPRTADG